MKVSRNQLAILTLLAVWIGYTAATVIFTWQHWPLR